MRNTNNAIATIYVNADRQDRTNVAVGVDALRYHHSVRMCLFTRRALESTSNLLGGSKPGRMPRIPGAILTQQQSLLGLGCGGLGSSTCRRWERPNVSSHWRSIS